MVLLITQSRQLLDPKAAKCLASAFVVGHVEESVEVSCVQASVGEERQVGRQVGKCVDVVEEWCEWMIIERADSPSYSPTSTRGRGRAVPVPRNLTRPNIHQAELQLGARESEITKAHTVVRLQTSVPLTSMLDPELRVRFRSGLSFDRAVTRLPHRNAMLASHELAVSSQTEFLA